MSKLGEVAGPGPLRGMAAPTRRLAAQINPSRHDANTGPRLRQGVVAAINPIDPPSVDILLNGASAVVPFARYMAGYVPSLSDTVWCLQNGSDLLVLGDLQARANAISTPASNFVGGNWYRVAWTKGGATDGAGSTTNQGSASLRAHGRFAIADQIAGRHGRIEFGAGIAYGNANTGYISTAYSTSYGTNSFTKARFVYKGTYDRTYLDVWFPTTTAASTAPFTVSLYDNDWPDGWVLNPDWGTGPIPANSMGTTATGYLTREWLFADDGDSWNPLTLSNGWVSFDGGTSYEIPAWRYGTDGNVHLQGLMKHATTSTTGVFATMGAGMKPKKNLLFVSLANGGAVTGSCRLDVSGLDGALSLSTYSTGASGGYVSLSGVYWRPGK